MPKTGRPATRKAAVIRLTAEDAEEVAHKLGILRDEPELQEDYHLTQEEADILYRTIPAQGGIWVIPVFATEAVKGELEDHANVLRSIAHDARRNGEVGQSLRINKQAKKFEELFS